jgi:hypothetical protein
MKGTILIVLALSLLGASSFANNHDKKEEAQPPAKPVPRTVNDGTKTYVIPDYLNTEVNKYIKDVLSQDPQEFNISLKHEKDIVDNKKVFENFETDVLVKMMHGFLRESYGNVLETGEAGSGKTSDLQKMVLFFSYGSVPEEVRKELQMDNPMLKQFYDSRIGHTQVIDVSIELISQDNTPLKKAFPSQDERMKQVIKALFVKAREDFLKTGLRTLFVFDEVGTYPELVQQTLKKPLDKTGYKNIASEFELKQDTGVSALALTTYWEARALIRADSAVERRYFIIPRKNITDEKAFLILKDKAERLKGKFDGINVSEEALQYIVAMNEYLNSPPQAMPASTNNGLDELVNWFIFSRSKNGTVKDVSLSDAQAWFMNKLGFSDAWLPGPNGEPPFHDLAARLKAKVKDQDEAMDQIALAMEAWARLDFGGPPPVILLLGGTASGKNTAIRALNEVLFNNPNDNLRFSIGGKSGYTYRQLFQGSEANGSNLGAAPLLLQALESGNGLGVINLDEGADAPSIFYSEVKVIIEKGQMEPIGFDRRVRNLFLPIVISGQWGEHLFAGLKTDAEIRDRIKSLTQDEIDKALLHPGGPEGYGAVPVAFIQRVKKSGAIILMPPTPKASYQSIVEDIYIKEFVAEMKTKNNLVIAIDPSVTKEVVRQTLAKGEDPRGLEATFIRLVKYGLSESAKKGIPLRDANLNISMDDKGVIVSVIGQHETKAHIDFDKILSRLDLCALKMDGLHK